MEKTRAARVLASQPCHILIGFACSLEHSLDPESDVDVGVVSMDRTLWRVGSVPPRHFPDECIDGCALVRRGLPVPPMVEVLAIDGNGRGQLFQPAFVSSTRICSSSSVIFPNRTRERRNTKYVSSTSQRQ